MRLEALIEEFRTRCGGLEDSRAKAVMSDMRAAGIEDGERLRIGFDNWRARWKFKYAPTAAQFREFYPDAVEPVAAQAYFPGHERLTAKLIELKDEWNSYLLKNFGHPDATRVLVHGIECSAKLHPLNSWMHCLGYDKRLNAAAYAVCAHEDGRMPEADMLAARRALQLSMADVDRAKAIDAKTPVVNASPFTIEPIPGDPPAVEASA